MNAEKIIAAVMAAPTDRHADIIKAARGKTNVPPQPITAREACAILGCCRATLRRMEKRGLIQAQRLSKRLIRYDRTEVFALLARSELTQFEPQAQRKRMKVNRND